MGILNTAFLLLLASAELALASDNGLYYACDATKLASDNKCVFTLTGAQPEDWVAETEHNIDIAVGPDFYRGVQNYDGTMLSASPKPWVNGVKLAASDTAITEDLWSYSLIFELIAPLRDMMMYHPEVLIADEDLWLFWTRALTDCNAKTEDYVADRGGAALSTTQVYDISKDPKGLDIHHNVLQYLEEGAIDLVCLSTELEMTHCDGTREAAGSVLGERCNCWFDAYEAIYGACPVVDKEYTTCSLTTAPTVCGETTEEEPIEEITTVEVEVPEASTPPSGMPGRGRR